MDSLAIWRYVFRQLATQITNPQLLDFLFELLPRYQGVSKPRPSAAPHMLGAWQGLLQSFMIRAADCTSSACEPRFTMHTCISSCDPVQVFTFLDGITSASGRLQMSLDSVGIHLGPGIAPVPINYFENLHQ